MAITFGLWHYGDGLPRMTDMGTDGEAWPSLARARQSLVDRYRHGYWHTDSSSGARVVNVDDDGIATLGESSAALRPAVGDDTSIDLYAATRVGRGKWIIHDYPYARLTLGPRGGVRVENY